MTIELIADGVHLHPALYSYVAATTAANRIALVTDAMDAAGLGDGSYRLGAMDVDVSDGVAHIVGTDTIPGSTTTMDRLFRAAVANLDTKAHPERPSDAALLSAVEQTSVNPARTLDRDDIGRLEVGRRADVVVLDHQLAVRKILVGGENHRL